MRNKYILLRHGETKYQEEKILFIYTKKENPTISITKKGEKRIKAIAQKLKVKRIDLIYSSPYKRTRQTANIVAKELGLRVNFDKRLIDTDFGVFHGKSIAEYRKLFKEEKEKFFKKPFKGENWKEVQIRVLGFIKEIDKKYKNKIILIVSHGDPIWFSAGFLKGLSNKQLIKKRYKDFRPYKGFYAGTSQFIEI